MAHLNMFLDKAWKSHAIGLVHDAHGLRTGLWYFDKGKRQYLDENQMVHIETLPVKGTSPKAMVWSYKDWVYAYRVQVTAFGHTMERIAYGIDRKKAIDNSLFAFHKKYNLELGKLIAFVKEHPTYMKVTILYSPK